MKCELMKALMQVRAYRAGGTRKFPGEPSVSLAKTERIIVPSPYNIAGITRTNLGLRGVSGAKGAVGSKFMSIFAVTSQ